jgi:hypothetical protein
MSGDGDSEWDWVKPGVKAESVDVEEVWNQCTVLKKLPAQGKVKVRYDGWDASFDEDIPLSEQKLAKLGTHTLRRRCWVKVRATYPAIALLRSASSKKGVAYLESEEKLLFLVQSEKKSEFMFLEPKKCLSWSAHVAQKANKSALERNKEELCDDELPVLFSKGTLPADACLQLGNHVRKVQSDDPIRPSPKKRAIAKQVGVTASSSPTRASSSPTQASIAKTEHSPQKKPRVTADTYPLFFEPEDETTNPGIAFSSAPFEPTPSQRLARLAKSISESVIARPAAASVSQRSLGSPNKARLNDDASARDVWGRGSSVSSDDFSMRGLASKTLRNS